MHTPLDRPERRKVQRIPMALPVELPEGTGITRDLSVCGVFFETDRTFLPGEAIQFTLVLEYLDPRQPVRLQCQGRVVRIEPHGELTGVAVAITAYRFTTATRSGMESVHRSSRTAARRGPGRDAPSNDVKPSP